MHTRVTFEENQRSIENEANHDFCTLCTHHKHLAKDCFKNPSNPRNRNNSENQVRAIRNQKKRKVPTIKQDNTVRVEHHSIEHQGENVQPLNSKVDTTEKVFQKEEDIENIDNSIEGRCLINELPTSYIVDTGAQISVISDRVYSRLKNPSPLEKVPNVIAGAGGAGLATLVVIKDLVSDCLLGMDLLEQFPYFSQPIDKLRETVKQLSKDFVNEPKYYLQNTLSKSCLINTISDINLNLYLEKINTLIKSISAASLKELKPSPCFEHEIKLIDPSLPPIRQKMRRIPY
ncbi:hypothetical protein BpHYR1_029706, partial [Brachionus plicatilis]